MKSILFILFAATLFTLTALTRLAHSQQIAPQITAVTNIPPVTWKGTNAQVIAGQLLALTNANGTRVLPATFFTNRPVTVVLVRVQMGTNGLQSISAQVR